MINILLASLFFGCYILAICGFTYYYIKYKEQNKYIQYLKSKPTKQTKKQKEQKRIDDFIKYLMESKGLNEEDATIQAYERREKAKFKERIDAHNRYKKFKNLYNKK